MKANPTSGADSSSDTGAWNLTRGYLRNAAWARILGWGAACPLFLLFFSEANAADHWYAVAMIASYVYPAVMAWLTAQVKAPVRLVMAGLGIESCMLAVFAEVACADPLFMLVCISVMVINAGMTRGWKGALAVFLLFCASFLAVNGQLRAVPSANPPAYLHIVFGLYLMGYLGVTAHQVYALVVRNGLNKRALLQQRNQIDSLHQHLIDTISDPFVSDEAVLKLIGPKLTAEQARTYAARIRTRQRWEAIGREARSISHDANNLLTPMTVMTELLGDHIGTDTEARACLTDLDSAVQQLHSLHLQLNPQRGQRAPATPSVLQYVVHDVLALVRTSAPAGLEVVLENELQKDLVYVAIDAGSLHRCLLNICTNAIQAMAGGGVLTVRLRPASDTEQARIRGPQKSPGFVLCVEDTGHGMPPQVAERVFEPYFTTRTDDGGTGLGLATTHALVTDAGGSIALDSTPGVGTALTLVLPTLA